MRILICDDDEKCISILSNYIIQFFDSIKVSSYEIVSYMSGRDILKDKESMDIIFLDIEMPEINGIRVGEMIKSRNKESIIFVVTSYNEYLDDAMRFNVFRYISKPIDKHRLFRNLNDAIRKHNESNKKIALETKDGVHVEYLRNIVYLEIQTRKRIVHTTKEEYEVIQPVQYWLQLLKSGAFFRSHRNYIINMKYVSDFSRDAVWLCDGRYQVYLTRRNYKSFKDSYILFLESNR